MIVLVGVGRQSLSLAFHVHLMRLPIDTYHARPVRIRVVEIVQNTVLITGWPKTFSIWLL